MARLAIRTGRADDRPKSLAERIDDHIDELYRLRSIADNERRSHAVTEQMIDGIYETGRLLCRLARG